MYVKGTKYMCQIINFPVHCSLIARSMKDGLGDLVTCMMLGIPRAFHFHIF